MALWKGLMEDKAETELTKLLKDKIITKSDIKVLLRWGIGNGRICAEVYRELE